MHVFYESKRDFDNLKWPYKSPVTCNIKINFSNLFNGSSLDFGREKKKISPGRLRREFSGPCNLKT